MAATATIRVREAEDKRARFGYRQPAARTPPSSAPLQEGPARAGDDGRASGGAGATSRGRAQRLEELCLKELEALALDAVARILARQHGTVAKLRPTDVLRELGVEHPSTALRSAVADILKRYPAPTPAWKLPRVEKNSANNTCFYYVRVHYKCPLCGKTVRRRSAASHAFSHIEKLEKSGVVKLERENGSWVVYHNGKKYHGASWLTLLKVAEDLKVGACPETRWARAE
jgi:predicted RNA-binding Zn-ribbon protein involved in translation (DUF1610 family)